MLTFIAPPLHPPAPKKTFTGPGVYFFVRGVSGRVMAESPSLAELSDFVGTLVGDCVVMKCDDGLYICHSASHRFTETPTLVSSALAFRLSEGELAAHIRAMTDDSSSDSGAVESSATAPSDNASTSSAESDNSAEDEVVVKVTRRKRQRQS